MCASGLDTLRRSPCFKRESCYTLYPPIKEKRTFLIWVVLYQTSTYFCLMCWHEVHLWLVNLITFILRFGSHFQIRLINKELISFPILHHSDVVFEGFYGEERCEWVFAVRYTTYTFLREWWSYARCFDKFVLIEKHPEDDKCKLIETWAWVGHHQGHHHSLKKDVV